MILVKDEIVDGERLLTVMAAPWEINLLSKGVSPVECEGEIHYVEVKK